jgi:threonine aldolase
MESAPDPRILARTCTRRLSGAPPKTFPERSADWSRYEFDPDRYGSGGQISALEHKTAELLGVEAAAFFPTGTMAQQVALRVWAERSGDWTVALHPLHHPEMRERNAYSRVSGLASVWPTVAARYPTPEEVRAADSFGTFFLELPMREAGFLLPTWDELTELVAAARERGARIHLDGARLWESADHLGHSLPEITALADSVYVSFYKSLGGISGAALAGPADFIKQAVAWRHRYGGQIVEQWPAVLAALTGLEMELPRLETYVRRAPEVAAALSAAGFKVFPDPPHTQQFQIWLPHPAAALDAAHLRMAEEHKTWMFFGWDERPGGMSMCEVTVAAPTLEWTSEEITEAARVFLGYLSE